MPSRKYAAHTAQRYAIRGFTLFEMVVVMGIVGILMAIAIPSYQYVTNSNRISAEVNGLLGDLQFARSEAIKEGQPVSVCVSTNGTSCTNSTSWQNGWIVFSDQNGNGAVNSPPDQVLRAQSTFSGTDTFTANNNIAVITFNREGFAAGVPIGALLTLHAATPAAGSTRCLSITLIGLMTVQAYGVGACT
ncbi:MAG: GspH/FimT family pseudopilin [Steroidobacteraceae bacterium]